MFQELWVILLVESSLIFGCSNTKERDSTPSIFPSEVTSTSDKPYSATASSNDSIGEKIIHGRYAKPNEIKYIALLRIRRTEKNNGTWESVWKICGGSIVTHYWIVTAAHCLDEPAIDAFVDVGEDDRGQYQKGEFTRFVTKEDFFTHEKYNGDVEYGFDIGLVFVSPTPRMNLTKRMAWPIDLPYFGSVKITRESRIQISGWGWTKANVKNSTSVKLKVADVYYVEPERCKRLFAKIHRRPPPSGTICAEGQLHKDGTADDTCKGDSGGPLTLIPKKGKPILIGVVSYGFSCGVKDQPGVYTDVRKHFDWIIAKSHEVKS